MKHLIVAYPAGNTIAASASQAKTPEQINIVVRQNNCKNKDIISPPQTSPETSDTEKTI